MRKLPAANPGRDLLEDRLHEAATKLFATKGFASTTLQDIADAVGVVREGLYHYVSSKEDFLARLVDEYVEAVRHVVHDLPYEELTDPVGTLYEQTRRSVADVIAHPYRSRAMLRAQTYLPPDLAERFLAMQRDILGRTTRLISAGIDQGVFAPVNPRHAALALAGMANCIAWLLDPPSATEIAGIAREIAGLAVHGLQPSDGDALSPRAAVEGLRVVLDTLEAKLGLAGEEVGR